MEKWDLYDEHGQLLSKTSYRGNDLEPGEYHLVVSTFIKNSRGEYLISQRSQQKNGAGQLETVGGAALAGEDSETAIIREVSEEIGLDVSKAELKFLKRLIYTSRCSYFFDVWLIEKDVDLESLNLQVAEVAEVMWLDQKSVEDMIYKNLFFNSHIYREVLGLA